MGNLTYILTETDAWDSIFDHTWDILSRYPGFEAKLDEGAIKVSCWRDGEEFSWYWERIDGSFPRDAVESDGTKVPICFGVYGKHPRPGFDWMYWVWGEVSDELMRRLSSHSPRLYDEGVGFTEFSEIKARGRRDFRTWLADTCSSRRTGKFNRVRYGRIMSEFRETAPTSLIDQELHG